MNGTNHQIEKINQSISTTHMQQVIKWKQENKSFVIGQQSRNKGTFNFSNFTH